VTGVGGFGDEGVRRSRWCGREWSCGCGWRGRRGWVWHRSDRDEVCSCGTQGRRGGRASWNRPRTPVPGSGGGVRGRKVGSGSRYPQQLGLARPASRNAGASGPNRAPEPSTSARGRLHAPIRARGWRSGPKGRVRVALSPIVGVNAARIAKCWCFGPEPRPPRPEQAPADDSTPPDRQLALACGNCSRHRDPIGAHRPAAPTTWRAPPPTAATPTTTRAPHADALSQPTWHAALAALNQPGAPPPAHALGATPQRPLHPPCVLVY
jgi:hypothetical protein